MEHCPNSRVLVTERDGRTVLTLRPGAPRGHLVGFGLLSLGALGLAWLVVGWALFDGWPPFYYPRPSLSERVFASFVIAATAIATARVLRIFAGFLLFREQIICDHSTLCLRRGTRLLAPLDHYDLRYVSRLRAVAEASLVPDPDARDPWRSTIGRNVAFDYGPRTVRFGLRLNEPEAHQAVALLTPHLGATGRTFSYSEHEVMLDELARGARPLPPSRAQVQETGDELRVVVPGLRSFTFAIMCAVALAFLVWQTIEMWRDFSTYGLLAARHLFLLVLFLVATTRRALWNAFGREAMALSRDQLAFARHYGVFRTRRSYRPTDVSHVELSLSPASALGGNALPDRGSLLVYTAQDWPWRFGVGLEEAEAEALRRLLLEHIARFTGAL